MPTPLLIVGDSPSLPTGLGRIARDLSFILLGRKEELQIDLAVLGLGWNGSRWPFHIYPLRDEDNWGEGDFQAVWEDFAGDQPGIILSIWDPARCFPLAKWKEERARGVRADLVPSLWGYFAVDAQNQQGKIGGPAADALRLYDQVLAYGTWGAGVLAKTLGRERVPWLPHGYFGLNFFPVAQAQRRLVGCVAANQPRKDLGALFEVWADLLRRDENLVFWLHTDILVKYWSVPELIEVYGLEDRVLITEPGLDDSALRSLYSQCLVTIAPGLGEGFGYPIVESLACGTPVIGVDYGGGAEWIPCADWRMRPATGRVDGTYALIRPVIDVEAMAAEAARAIAWMRAEPAVVQGFCRGAVANLHWGHLAGRWDTWFRRVLTKTREGWPTHAAEEDMQKQKQEWADAAEREQAQAEGDGNG